MRKYQEPEMEICPINVSNDIIIMSTALQAVSPSYSEVEEVN